MPQLLHLYNGHFASSGDGRELPSRVPPRCPSLLLGGEAHMSGGVSGNSFFPPPLPGAVTQGQASTCSLWESSCVQMSAGHQRQDLWVTLSSLLTFALLSGCHRLMRTMSRPNSRKWETWLRKDIFRPTPLLFPGTRSFHVYSPKTTNKL